jgi:hypothetical protein
LKVNYKESELVASSYIATLFSSGARGKVLEEREIKSYIAFQKTSRKFTREFGGHVLSYFVLEVGFSVGWWDLPWSERVLPFFEQVPPLFADLGCRKRKHFFCSSFTWGRVDWPVTEQLSAQGRSDPRGGLCCFWCPNKT